MYNPGEGNGNPLQYLCQENSMNRGVWPAIVHWVTELDMTNWLTFAFKIYNLVSFNKFTWVWVNSGSWWWTGRPGVLQFMGSQRVGHNWATELNWINSQCCAPLFSSNRFLSNIPQNFLLCSHCPFPWLSNFLSFCLYVLSASLQSHGL